MSISLPPPGPNQAYVDLSALEAGTLQFPAPLFLEPALPDDTRPIPALSFLLRHSVTNTAMVFDLGLSNDISPPRNPIFHHFQPWQLQSAADSLSKGGVDPTDIKFVVISHLHFDHIGDPIPFTKSMGRKGYFPSDRIEYLDPEDGRRELIGPYPRALDFYGDGSVYIVDAPGHIAGHINILARTSADGGWAYLAGDTAHDYRILTGEYQIAEYPIPGANFTYCSHDDKDLAHESIARLRTLKAMDRVRVLLAHDGPFFFANRGGPAFLPGHIESL